MSHSPSGANGAKAHPRGGPIPLVSGDHRGYPSLKNSGVEQSLNYFDHEHAHTVSLKTHEYDDNIELFPVRAEQPTPVGPFSTRNADVKKQYYRYNLLQNKIQAIGNDS